MPMWLKLSPGKQVYAAGEIAEERRHGRSSQAQACLDEHRAAQAGKASAVRDEEEEEDVGNEGMYQLRGEASGDQDKFRVTVDFEQQVWGWCDEKTEPRFEWGVTSVIFTGTHLRLSNISEEGRWIETERFTADGKETVRLAGEPVPENLGRALRGLRTEYPELWQLLGELGVELYQQPAGFEDGIITSWKIMRQAKAAPCSVSLRDLFAGGLSDSARGTAMSFQQLCTFIRGKMTAAVQVTDTDVAFRIKAAVRRRQAELRKELWKLAQAEDTRAVFKCGVYEVLRTLAEAIEEQKEAFRRDETLKKACYRNGWTVLRPRVSQGRFVRASEEAWAKELTLGTRRLRDSWTAKRFDHVSEEGIPGKYKPLTKTEEAHEAEACYHDAPGDLRSLTTWTEMVEKGELSKEALKEITEQARHREPPYIYLS